MDDQRGEIPSLSALLAPSVYLTEDGAKLKRLPPSDKYIAALRAEGRQIPDVKSQRVQGPIDAEDYTAELQIFYVRCAIKDGDWRAMRGTRPTPRMQDLFVIGRAKYLAWKKRCDEEEEREASLPKSWFEIEEGRFVLATSEETARAFIESIKPVTTTFETRERIYTDVDTSKTCSRCKLRRKANNSEICITCIEIETGIGGMR